MLRLNCDEINYIQRVNELGPPGPPSASASKLIETRIQIVLRHAQVRVMALDWAGLPQTRSISSASEISENFPEPNNSSGTDARHKLHGCTHECVCTWIVILFKELLTCDKLLVLPAGVHVVTGKL